MHESEVPDPDAQEQGDPDRVQKEDEPVEVPQEVPEGDAVEQGQTP